MFNISQKLSNFLTCGTPRQWRQKRPQQEGQMYPRPHRQSEEDVDKRSLNLENIHSFGYAMRSQELGYEFEEGGNSLHFRRSSDCTLSINQEQDEFGSQVHCDGYQDDHEYIDYYEGDDSGLPVEFAGEYFNKSFEQLVTKSHASIAFTVKGEGGRKCVPSSEDASRCKAPRRRSSAGSLNSFIHGDVMHDLKQTKDCLNHEILSTKVPVLLVDFPRTGRRLAASSA